MMLEDGHRMALETTDVAAGKDPTEHKSTIGTPQYC